MCAMNSFNPRLLLVILAMLAVSVFTAYSQQDLIANKNNTRTDVTRPFSNPTSVSFFSAQRENGLNEIKWASFNGQNATKFIVEYSTDGIHYQSAGEVVANPGNYEFKHHIFEIHPLLYRLKIEGTDGKYAYSQTIFLDGMDNSPVKIYPSIITGGSLHAIANLPVERIAVTTSNGQQLFAQSVGGNDNYLSVPIPASLAKGMYWITFTGQGWQSTGKFIIP